MKDKIRKEIMTLRKEIPVELSEEKSDKITEKVLNHPRYQKAGTVFCYVDAKGEVKTGKIIEDAWKKGKKIAVPKVHGDIMEFYLVSAYEQLEEGCFGIREPKDFCEQINTVSEDAVVIMPGVAFDRNGNRIGYGKGYYDKYFGEYPEIYKIAIAYEIQIVDAITPDIYDVKADCVITEKS